MIRRASRSVGATNSADKVLDKLGLHWRRSAIDPYKVTRSLEGRQMREGRGRPR